MNTGWRTYEVPATPEQVWEAIATADGMTAWMVPATIDPRVGGEVTFDLGDYTSVGTVTEFSPPHRLAYAEPWPVADNMPTANRDLSQLSPLATEFLVESTSGGSCIIRVVTSGYGAGDEWEHEFFSEMEEGWGALLDNLAVHLGRPVLR
ncbi:MAG: SRPBCC domain-containing protein [Acidimicrobiales bacterium]